MRLSAILGLPIAEPDDARRDFPTMVDDPRTTKLEAHSIPRFATAAARDAAIPAPVAGMHCFVNDLTVSIGGLTQRYEGGAWKVIAGDTGWRNIASGMVSGWTAAYGLMIRRDVGNTVHVGMQGLKHATAGSRAIYATAPAGFAPSSWSLYSVTTTMDATTGAMLTTQVTLRDPGGWLYVNSQQADPVQTWGQIIYLTDNAWPTTLPGTPG